MLDCSRLPFGRQAPGLGAKHTFGFCASKAQCKNTAIQDVFAFPDPKVR